MNPWYVFFRKYRKNFNLYHILEQVVQNFASESLINLNEKEVQITKKMNGFDEQDDSIQTIICHDLNMVEIKHSLDDNCKNQYENVSEVFLGELLGMWKSGMQLRLVERVKKSYKYIYYKYTGFDYWIKLAGRNIHFYLGRPFRYTCIVSSNPLDTNQTFRLFRESV